MLLFTYLRRVLPENAEGKVKEHAEKIAALQAGRTASATSSTLKDAACGVSFIHFLFAGWHARTGEGPQRCNLDGIVPRLLGVCPVQ